MQDRLYAILYRSSALIPERSADEIAMRDTAIARNAAAHITGLLHREDDIFYQWLEGPEAAVDTVFGSITRDPRHHSLEVLSRQPLAHRHFPDWSMGYTSVNAISLFDWASTREISLRVADGASILRFLQECSFILKGQSSGHQAARP